MSKDPIKQFSHWLEEAKKTHAMSEPTAMSLATSTTDGTPSVRMVLLKGLDERGFVFYTNLNSRKSIDLTQNPKAAGCFYWMPMERQVRVEGKIEKVSNTEADAYFSTRSRDSQIGAWVSKQSQPLPERTELLQAISNKIAEYDGIPVPRPPFWSGWRIIPNKIEFWQQGDSRLHVREVFTKNGNNWEITSLYP